MEAHETLLGEFCWGWELPMANFNQETQTMSIDGLYQNKNKVYQMGKARDSVVEYAVLCIQAYKFHSGGVA